MSGGQAHVMTKYLRIGTVFRGALFMGISFVYLPASVYMAEILYAEDFDRAGFTPAWFSPWWLAMTHPYVSELIFLIVGVAMVVIGALLAKQHLVAQRWVDFTYWIAAICCLPLAAAMIPLASMGGNWVSGTPAHEVRRTVIAGIGAVCFEIVLLLCTILALWRIRKGLGGRHDSSEA